MSVLRITARDGTTATAGGAPPGPALDAGLARRDGPVTIMVHGFKYAPGAGRHCPHETIFSLAPRHREADPRIVSWPRHLGLGRSGPGNGLAVSFAWPARGAIWQAYEAASGAGAALAALIDDIRRRAPGRPVHAIGHSLGARVILEALSRAGPGALDWAVLLAPAEFARAARGALHSPAGRTARVLAVSSRENDLFDLMMELTVTPACRGDRMLGVSGLAAPNALTLQIDHARSLAALARAGFRIAPPRGRICHWSPYLRPGAFPLYRALIEERLDFARLRAILPEDTDPRWARLLPYRRGAAGPGAALRLPN